MFERNTGVTPTLVGTAGSLKKAVANLAKDIELRKQLKALQRRAKRKRSHKLRAAVVFSGGAAIVGAVLVRLGLRRNSAAAIREEIDLAVPVSAAYNQWTQFEEFPLFMEGVDEEQRVVMALDVERRRALAEDLDLGRRTGLDPERRALGAGVAQHRA